MRKTLLIFILTLSLLPLVHGQDNFQFPSSKDVGVNITNVISTFIGNSGPEVDLASFPFAMKWNRKKRAIRLGLGLTFDNTNETLATVEQFIFNNYQVNSRIGIERKKYLGNKFAFFYGLDFLFVLTNEESTVSNNVDVTSLRKNTIGLGGGPVYGFEYYLNKRMYLGTEGSFYGLFKIAKETQEFEFNPTINKEISTRSFDARILPPISLYVMVRF